MFMALVFVIQKNIFKGREKKREKKNLVFFYKLNNRPLVLIIVKAFFEMW